MIAIQSSALPCLSIMKTGLPSVADRRKRMWRPVISPEGWWKLAGDNIPGIGPRSPCAPEGRRNIRPLWSVWQIKPKSDRIKPKNDGRAPQFHGGPSASLPTIARYCQPMPAFARNWWPQRQLPLSNPIHPFPP
jgi:hypothetical protein